MEPERHARPLSRLQRSLSKGRSPSKRLDRKSMEEGRNEKKPSSLRWRKLRGRSTGLDDLHRLANSRATTNGSAPPSYDDDTGSALALPLHRFSESNASEASNGTCSSDQIYGSTTTTTHTVSTHTTFFKLPRGNRDQHRQSLFPLPLKVPLPDANERNVVQPATPRASSGGLDDNTESTTPHGKDQPETLLQRRHTEDSPTKKKSLPTSAGVKQSLSFVEPRGNFMRDGSQRSRASSRSSPLHPPARLGMRDRASTTSSFGRSSRDMSTPPPLYASARNSTSTSGRTSLGGIFALSRFRNGSDPHSPRHASPGSNSKSNSFALSREALVVPEREEGDTPGKYLERLEAAVARSMIAGILSKSADPFAQAVLRSYTRRFRFFGEPIDMSLRKFLLEADLPKETQQVDRVIQAFADRYHECNPGIFVSPDQAYIVAFSLMMLHTDAFNKNNKRKMQKHDYIKNTSGQAVSDDVLGCFYDNICYTPFVHYEEEVDINGERVLPFKPKRTKLQAPNPETGKKSSGPVDPYNVLIEQKLDMLRPPIKESILMEDPYDYQGTQKEFDPDYLQRAFTHTGVLQIVSQRSRPSAYEGQFTNGQPPTTMDVQPGIIDLKITKVGLLWRKAAKKKKARSPWQEWGAVLTGSQLYLFKNAHWAKGLVHQFMAAQRHGQPRTPVVFKPPLQEFKPDVLIKTDNAVALVDATYTRHKNAFTFVRPGIMEETFLADNENELNDWLALINYAAAFRAAGVRIRGMVGGAEEDLRGRDLRRETARPEATTSSALATRNRNLSPQLHRQVMAARRQIMLQKVSEATTEIDEANKQLEHLLRNARHLLVLAPIAPRTREDIIHAAAHADASIKWTRRDIWRMKCHKDILAMDVQQDGVPVSEADVVSGQQADTPETAKKNNSLMGLLRLNSKTSAATRSRPTSATSPTLVNRPSTNGSIEEYLGGDVFQTPPEMALQESPGADWNIPPLQMEILRQEREEQHRTSVTGTLLSASSQAHNSASHASSATSSIRRSSRVIAEEAIEEIGNEVRPVTGIDHRAEAEKMPRRTTSFEKIETTTSRRNMNLDGLARTASTPENKQHRSSGVRRSLQKTLRDGHHAASGGSGKHKRGKESDSTIRSNTTPDAEGAQDGTPGLKRGKGRFILHGKQASVVQFGADWPNDKMKLRREQHRQHDDERRRSRTFSFNWRASKRDSQDEGRSSIQMQANAAATALDAIVSPESPSRLPSTHDQHETVLEKAQLSPYLEYKDNMEDRSRCETVIPWNYGLKGLQKGEDGMVVTDDESAHASMDGNNKRRMVIQHHDYEGLPAYAESSTNGGAEEEDDEAGEAAHDDETRMRRASWVSART